LAKMIPGEKGQLTVGEAAARMARGNRTFCVPISGGNWWSFEVLGLKICCYNFNWRRRALYVHDLHHIVTGYPTMHGEMQVATWEFSAGRFPSLYANLFCLPLVAAGALLIPAETFRAFQEGIDSRSLYGRDLDGEALHWPVEKLRALSKKTPSRFGSSFKLLAFAALSSLAFLEIAALLIGGAYLLSFVWA
jgi:hypothetical protein